MFCHDSVDRCLPVPETDNATSNTLLALAGTEVNFTCEFGYRYDETNSASQSIYCDNQQWTDLNNSCSGTGPYCSTHPTVQI